VVAGAQGGAKGETCFVRLIPSHIAGLGMRLGVRSYQGADLLEDGGPEVHLLEECSNDAASLPLFQFHQPFDWTITCIKQRTVTEILGPQGVSVRAIV